LLLLLLLLEVGISTNVVKVHMVESILSRDTAVGLIVQHLHQEIHAKRVNHGDDSRQRLGRVVREIFAVLRVLCHTGPCLLRGCPHDLEDLDELVLVVGSCKEGLSQVHLCHDTASGPNVDRGRVSL